MTNQSKQNNDPVALKLRTYAQNILVVIFGLLPIIFFPSAIAPFEYTKVLVVIVGIFLALILYSLSVLRSGVLSIGISYPLIALWVIAGISLVSSLLSGDFSDSLVGDFFSIHSTTFVAVLALIPTVWIMLRASKIAVMKMYLLLAGSTIVLVLYHVSRLIFGQNFLTFGLFTNTVTTPVGTWNDLGLFLGLTIILSLIVLEQLTLTKIGKSLFVIVIVLSLGMLGVINFFTVWLILGLSSLAIVVYTLGKDRFSNEQMALIHVRQINMVSLIMGMIIFVVSVMFVIGGSTLGGWITQYTHVSYVEVRPSLEATANIARNVYHQNAFLGIGPNKFVDAWRLYKEDSINATPFWNTDFNAGNGYVSTFFVTTGMLGGIAWLVFILLYVVTGIRRLIYATEGDKMWYFIGVSSFVSAVYVWGMSLIYVPGVTILLIGSLCTGVSLYAFTVLRGASEKFYEVGNNRRSGFILTLGVIVIIVGSVGILYITGRHYASIYAFNESVQLMQSGTPIDELEKKVLSAYALASSDIFPRRIAEYQFSRLNALASLTEPTDAQKKEFNDATVNGIRFGQEAIRIDAQEPANWEILASIYNVLASINVEGASDKVREALTKSRDLNPKNPLPYLELAIVEARSGNYELAHTYIQNAITLKPNFTDAYFVLTQLEIAQGNVKAALNSTHAVIALEPENPIRYYQLGVLEGSDNNIDGAITAFEKAVALDTNYANARYLLALAYDTKGRSADALSQFKKVLELNPGNTEVTNLINVLNTEGSLNRLRTKVSNTVNEATPTTNETGNVSTTQKDTNTPLVTPVNTPPKDAGTTTSTSE